MPKKEEAREVDDRDEGEVELPRPINLGDTLTIKRLLDEATAATVENCNYPPDNTLSNIQLFWGVNAVLIAPLAHFYPLPFPESRTILFICCVCYFFCYGVLQAITAFVEKDNILFTKAKEGNPAHPHGLAIRTNLPRFDDNFIIVLEQRCKGGQSEPLEMSITNWFDKTGYFHEEKFCADVKKLIQETEKKWAGKSQ